MANYDAWARTNYVKVSDLEGLKSALEPFQLTLIESSEEGYYCLLCEYEGGWGEVIYNDEGEDVTFDFLEHVMPYVEVGQVLVFQEVGYEKLRYLTGYSCALIRRADNSVDSISINLVDIYDLAKEKFGVEHVTSATY